MATACVLQGPRCWDAWYPFPGRKTPPQSFDSVQSPLTSSSVHKNKRFVLKRTWLLRRSWTSTVPRTERRVLLLVAPTKYCGGVNVLYITSDIASKRSRENRRAPLGRVTPGPSTRWSGPRQGSGVGGGAAPGGPGSHRSPDMVQRGRIWNQGGVVVNASGWRSSSVT